jgi:hypothetical protein
MGEFIDAAAVRAAPAPLAQALAGYLADHGVAATEVSDPDFADILLYPSAGGWTLMLWPQGAGGALTAAAEDLSRRLDAVASVISVFDGDFWSHVLFDRGDERDRFASMPNYFEEDPDRVEELRRRWAGHPAVVAATLDVPENQVAAYLVHESDDAEAEVDENGAYILPADYRPAMAFDDDASPIGGTWVFVDFWRRLGITYPNSQSDPLLGLELSSGWASRLPDGAEWQLD